MQISAVHRKRLDSKISFVFCWLEFTVSSLGCISFKVWRGKMPQIVPNLMNKMIPKLVKVTKSERICIWNRRDKFDGFFFYFTIVKGIACWRYASGKENIQHSQTLFSSVWLYHNPAQFSCAEVSAALIHCRATQISSAKRHLIPSSFPERELDIKSLRLHAWRIQIY